MSHGEVVLGLLFGDEGKGSMVDFLCAEKETDYVIRFSGGPQTAHNVVTDDGKHHTFAQFGSGFFQGAKTILSEYVLVNPFNMAVEADHLEQLTGRDPFKETYISEHALLITPLHVAANRQREINRGAEAHGSCGEGIGETRDYVENHLGKYGFGPMVVGDLIGCTSPFSHSFLRHKMERYQKFLTETIPNFSFSGNIDDILKAYDDLVKERKLQIVRDTWIYQQIKDFRHHNVFEGSQGILLDEDYGFHPHTTWSAVTDRNFRKLIARAGIYPNDYKRIGVTRTYTTRHGYGPFPSEFEGNGWQSSYPESFNAYGRFQGAWRAGLLDLPLLKYAIGVNKGLDSIALTHCDIKTPGVITGYEGLSELKVSPQRDLEYQENLTNILNDVKGQGKMVEVNGHEDIIELIEEATGVTVGFTAFGPTTKDRIRIG